MTLSAPVPATVQGSAGTLILTITTTAGNITSSAGAGTTVAMSLLGGTSFSFSLVAPSNPSSASVTVTMALSGTAVGLYTICPTSFVYGVRVPLSLSNIPVNLPQGGVSSIIAFNAGVHLFSFSPGFLFIVVVN